MRQGIKTGGIRSQSRLARGAAAIVVTLGLIAGGCGGGAGKPSEVCLVLVPSPNLNRVEGDPHVVVVSLYPLQNISAFNTTDPVDLLNGMKPPGVTGDSWDVTVYPGQIQKLEVKLPRDTAFVGLVADFYNGPSRAVIEADCPTFGSGTRIILTTSDLQAE